MHRIILTLTGLSLIPTLAFADVIDARVRDYVLTRITESDTSWYEDDRKDIESELKEMRRKPKASEIREAKEKIEDEKAKLIVVRELSSAARRNVTAENINEAVQSALAAVETKKTISEDIKSKEKALADTNSQIEVKKVEVTTQAQKMADSGDSPEGRDAQTAKEKAESEIKSLSSTAKTLSEEKAKLDTQVKELDKPVKIEGGLEVRAVVEEKGEGANKKKVVKLNLEIDKDRIAALPDDVRRKLTDEEIKEFFDKDLGADLMEKEFDANKKSDADIATEMSRDATVADLKKAAEEKVADVREKIGKTEDGNNLDKDDEAESTLGKLQKELNEKSGVGNAKKIRELEDKLAIAKYLKSNPSAKDLGPCELMVKALGGWSRLSADSKESCAELDPARAQRDRERDDLRSDEDRRQAEATQRARAQELADLQQHCEGLYRQRAMIDATAQITKPIDALMDKLVLEYTKSDIYAQACGPSTGEQQGADEFDRIAVDPRSEAARVARRLVSNPSFTSVDAAKGQTQSKLDDEMTALNLIVRRANYSLEKAGYNMGAAMAQTQQGAMLDMSQLQLADSKVQRMGTIYNCAKMAIESLDAAMNQRRMEVDGDILGTGAGTSTMNNQVGGVSMGASGATNNATPTARGGLRSGAGQRPATVRTNQILRNQSGAANGSRAPRPNYIGQ